MDEAAREKEEALLAIVGKWEQFLRLMNFKPDVLLDEKMRLFESPCLEFLKQEGGLCEQKAEHVALARALIVMAVEACGQFPKGAAFNAAWRIGWSPRPISKTSKSVLLSKVFARLNTPIKRVFAIVFAAGVLLLGIGLYQIATDSWGGSVLVRWGEVAFRTDSYATRKYWLAAWGTYITVTGALFSFFYDHTLAPIIKWVRHG